MAVQLACFSCGKQMEFPERVGLRDECPHCGADAHVCRNCELHDPKIYNECREPQSDPIRERDRSNRCDFFTPRSGGAGAVQDKAAAMRAAAEALFKKK